MLKRIKTDGTVIDIEKQPTWSSKNLIGRVQIAKRKQIKRLRPGITNKEYICFGEIYDVFEAQDGGVEIPHMGKIQICAFNEDGVTALFFENNVVDPIFVNWCWDKLGIGCDVFRNTELYLEYAGQIKYDMFQGGIDV